MVHQDAVATHELSTGPHGADHDPLAIGLDEQFRARRHPEAITQRLGHDDPAGLSMVSFMPTWYFSDRRQARLQAVLHGEQS